VVYEGLENHDVEVIVNAAPVETLGDEGTECLPGDLFRGNVGSAECQAVEPLVYCVQGAPEVCLVELVSLGPPDGGVPEALRDDGVEPGQQEVQSHPFLGGLLGAFLAQHVRIRPLEGRLYSGRRLEYELPAEPEQRLGYFGVDFHGEEHPELLVHLAETVDLLLQLREPDGSQVHILQQHPGASLAPLADSLFSLVEALRRPNGHRHIAPPQFLSQRVHFARRVVSWGGTQ